MKAPRFTLLLFLLSVSSTSIADGSGHREKALGDVGEIMGAGAGAAAGAVAGARGGMAGQAGASGAGGTVGATLGRSAGADVGRHLDNNPVDGSGARNAGQSEIGSQLGGAGGAGANHPAQVLQQPHQVK